MTTHNRERTYEAIYAAAFVREFCDLVEIRGSSVALERVLQCHEEAEALADAWLEMVQAAEGEQG